MSCLTGCEPTGNTNKPKLKQNGAYSIHVSFHEDIPPKLSLERTAPPFHPGAISPSSTFRHRIGPPAICRSNTSPASPPTDGCMFHCKLLLLLRETVQISLEYVLNRVHIDGVHIHLLPKKRIKHLNF
jgi:hypothetical protein